MARRRKALAVLGGEDLACLRAGMDKLSG